ncbi:MAG: phosphotransferase family protein [Rhodospirillaceae bacterium]|nr:phosphotransferase family protein [Rhodospirillaceae bacterium]MBT4932161.1 phosphotransferase family protein [Rhodospirillaceae bacterium]MBT5244725.1 phosphotransferase family protein [Rhodospirillaceae bacterium]MBT5562466.1 phosphotransferase family protein [Rhodospirillaceae bacterium]MBT6242104.1 phosphotransferase family protein [Rhodospirillaceae bacterium]
MRPDEIQSRLEPWLAQVSGANSVSLFDIEKLSGGAIQENWALSVTFSSGSLAGMQKLVLRTDAPSIVSASLNRSQEYALLKTAFEAGVCVPEPLWVCDDMDVLGRNFFMMRRVGGFAAGHKLVRDQSLGADLLKQLGQQLATIHMITPPSDELSFLKVPDDAPALRDIVQYRGWLDEFSAPYPVLEWGLSWLQRNAPANTEIVLNHRDFRTGNYMVHDGDLSGILDWEFAAWGDPMADIGWFCAKCWRFGATTNEAGGIGDRSDFYSAYEAASGRTIDESAVTYWEVMAHVRWAIIAVQQGNRFFIDGEENLEAALTAHVLPELELEIMRMTGNGT